MLRFSNISYSKLQTTLKYMTNLDRAVNNEQELKELSELYQMNNITALDLFRLLKRVSQMLVLS